MDSEALITLTELKSRGWNDQLIGQLLGQPDQLMANPHYRSGPKMRLYARARVLKAEASPDFWAVQALREARKWVEPKAD